MRKPFCCESSRHMFDQNYAKQQRGHGDFPVYVGRTRQRGHGLGNIIGSLCRRILPILKSFPPIALRTGARIFDDVNSGKTCKESAVKRVQEPISSYMNSYMNQSDNGVRRRRKAVKRKRSTKRKRTTKRKHTKKCKRDIFS